MKKFSVFLRGENFFINVDSVVKRMGFYTTRFVEALDRNEAEKQAVDSLRQHDRLRGVPLNDPSDPPMVFAEEINEIESFDDIEDLEPGLVFFDDDSTEH